MHDEQTQLQHFSKDTAFLEAHRDGLTRQHPDRWVAIYGEEVAGVATTLEELLDELEKNHIPVGQAVVECLETDPELLVLPA